jgi:hypothetical protein
VALHRITVDDGPWQRFDLEAGIEFGWQCIRIEADKLPCTVNNDIRADPFDDSAADDREHH